MTGHEQLCPRCQQQHCCVIEVRRCADLAKLTPAVNPQVSDEEWQRTQREIS